MSSTTTEHHACDNCGRDLPTWSNHVAIQTEKVKGPIGWSRLRVTIEHHHGAHNDGEVSRADLCKPCAVLLLENALARVKKGERVSAGIDTIDMLTFNKVM